MTDNLTLECFLSLLDKAERGIRGDYLSEISEEYEYSVSDKIQEKAVMDEREDISSCHLCKACLERNVFAEPMLNPDPVLLFVSLSPKGSTIFTEEGRAYFLKWLSAINLTRKDVALTSLIKCPLPSFDKEAADACRIHLRNEMSSLKPKAMVLLGKDVASYMLRRNGDMDSTFRKKRFSVNSIPVFCTYSPEELVLSRALRVPIWEDLKFISSSLGFGEKK